MRAIDADELKKHKYHDKKAWEYAVAVYYIDNAPTIKTKRIKYYDEEENVWKIGEVIVDGEREGE